MSTKDQQITYQVAFKGAIELLKGSDKLSGKTAAEAAEMLFDVTDEFYEQFLVRMPGSLVEPSNVSRLVPNAPITTFVEGSAPPEGGYGPGMTCPKCGQGQLVEKVGKNPKKDGTLPRWLQCSLKKAVKVGDGWEPAPGSCELSPFDDSWPDRGELWQ